MQCIDKKLSFFSDTAGKVLLTISGIVGLLLCFAGHRYFQTGKLNVVDRGFEP